MNALTLLATLVGTLGYLAMRSQGRLFAVAFGLLVAACVPVLVFA